MVTEDELTNARGAAARRSWLEGHEAFARADAGAPLDAEDLELYALTALMLARDDDAVTILERAHHRRLERGEHVPAATDAIWIGLNLAYRGAVGPASGWLGRAQRLLDQEPADCAQRGYLLLPTVFRLETSGEYAEAAATAAQAVAIGERFGDRDLFALALHAHGHCLALAGDVAEGLALLDEAMVAVTTGDLSPFVTGIVYCGVILACESVFEVGRAREWTGALARWAEQQQDLVAFTGRCLVHRAQILQLSGSWPDALEEARLAGDRLAQVNDEVAGVARYREAELLRLTGDFDAAEQAYREASRLGWEPQPGLAQLRLAQGRADAALTAIRRAGAELRQPLKRAAVLPAQVEIALFEGELEEARAACAELGELASAYESPMLAAMAAYSRGAVALADEDARTALGELREAQQLWLELQAPYEVARTRALLARVCSALADEESATLELEAAREIFERLGAAPDLARLAPAEPEPQHGLSHREIEVLRLVARGKSNREIAAELVISEHTVARHLQNIYTKLRLPSRAAATAFAFERNLV